MDTQTQHEEDVSGWTENGTGHDNMKEDMEGGVGKWTEERGEMEPYIYEASTWRNNIKAKDNRAQRGMERVGRVCWEKRNKQG